MLSIMSSWLIKTDTVWKNSWKNINNRSNILNYNLWHKSMLVPWPNLLTHKALLILIKLEINLILGLELIKMKVRKAVLPQMLNMKTKFTNSSLSQKCNNLSLINWNKNPNHFKLAFPDNNQSMNQLNHWKKTMQSNN